ncbi:hypothetical protein [Paragemmobacter straminiformis]|uniref:Uncharacterized protein n=1 Tax=Paragemmobacter straminiformis TaxID=2045119 RepID=A0A842IAU0_9RHOB|nr:hypothetical protein [Gemmobacter straminiformis]MBC2836523.1 hypothetical protein [Gemmobacter straminiformis]
MADYKVSGPEIKKFVKIMRREPVSFAYNPGDRPEDDYLGLHRLKPPQVLGKEAKEEGQGAKYAFGTGTVEGKLLTLTCERVLPGLAKKMKRCLKAQKVMLNVQILDADGTVLEADVEELPDDPELDDDTDIAQGAPAADPSNAPPPEAVAAENSDPAALKQRLAAIVPKVQALGGDLAERLRQACLVAGQQISSGSPEAAETLSKIENVLARQSASAPPAETAAEPASPEVPLARLKDAMLQLVQRIRVLPEGPARTKLGADSRTILGQINEGAVEAAITAMRRLTQELVLAEKPEAAPKADPMVVWRDAKETVDVSIGALQSALRGIDDPDLRRIADAGLNGVTDGLQTRLMAALFEYNAASGENRAKVAETLRGRAVDLRNMLETDPIIALCEDNPFGVKVAIRAPLIAALDKLEAIAGA